jgi:hypothetical protein
MSKEERAMEKMAENLSKVMNITVEAARARLKANKGMLK